MRFAIAAIALCAAAAGLTQTAFANPAAPNAAQYPLKHEVDVLFNCMSYAGKPEFIHFQMRGLYNYISLDRYQFDTDFAGVKIEDQRPAANRNKYPIATVDGQSAPGGSRARKIGSEYGYYVEYPTNEGHIVITLDPKSKHPSGRLIHRGQMFFDFKTKLPLSFSIYCTVHEDWILKQMYR